MANYTYVKYPMKDGSYLICARAKSPKEKNWAWDIGVKSKQTMESGVIYAPYIPKK